MIWLLLFAIASFPEALTREQIVAASHAAHEKLPPVDRAAVQVCASRFQHALQPGARTPGGLAAAADCYRAAGSLGMAARIQVTLVGDFPSAHEARAARRELGPAYEKLGQYPLAAEWYQAYASAEGRRADAREKLTRALCLWRQLDVADRAAQAQAQLEARAHRKLDGERLCRALRPIAAPK